MLHPLPAFYKQYLAANNTSSILNSGIIIPIHELLDYFFSCLQKTSFKLGSSSFCPLLHIPDKQFDESKALCYILGMETLRISPDTLSYSLNPIVS
jgi:hypothetical protein